MHLAAEGLQYSEGSALTGDYVYSTSSVYSENKPRTWKT